MIEWVIYVFYWKKEPVIVKVQSKQRNNNIHVKIKQIEDIKPYRMPEKFLVDCKVMREQAFQGSGFVKC